MTTTTATAAAATRAGRCGSSWTETPVANAVAVVLRRAVADDAVTLDV